jgi:3-deoxy-D-arabino-heptulosonate 7-phosphate (DAHP) synthase class II
MRIGLLAAVMALATATGSHAMGFHMESHGQLYTCARGPLARVSTLAATPAQCCDGKLQCPQFLATTTVLKPKHDPRT